MAIKDIRKDEDVGNYFGKSIGSRGGVSQNIRKGFREGYESGLTGGALESGTYRLSEMQRMGSKRHADESLSPKPGSNRISSREGELELQKDPNWLPDWKRPGSSDFPIEKELTSSNMPLISPGQFEKMATDSVVANKRSEAILAEAKSLPSSAGFSPADIKDSIVGLQWPFNGLKPNTLQTINQAVNENPIFTQDGSSIDSIKTLVGGLDEIGRNDTPLPESNYGEILSSLDDLLTRQIDNITNLSQYIQSDIAINGIVKPITEKLGGFIGNMGNLGNAVGNEPNFDRQFSQQYEDDEFEV